MTEPKAATWVLRWDTDREEKPRLIFSGHDGAAGVSVAPLESGGFAVFDGYLFDRDELGARPEESDAALVARAYQRWGEALCDKLRGSFTLAVWDDDRKLLIVARDALGLTPCYYRWDQHGFLLSSSLDALLAQPEVKAAVDRVVMVEYLLDTPTSQQHTETFYEEIKRLPSAHMLSLTRGHLVTRRYWDPVPPGFAWARPDELEAFPQVLSRSVRRCLGAGADCLGLSGGFDSVGLAVLAAGQAPRPIHALSLRFVHPDCDEVERQRAVASALGMPQLMLTMEESLGQQSLMDGLAALSTGSPCPLVSAWQPVYAGLFRSATGLGCRGLMMGSGGDDLLCVSLSYAAACLARGHFRRLWRFYQACRQTSSYSGARVARAVFWHAAIVPDLRRLAGSTLSALAPAFTEWLRRERRRHAVLRPWLTRTDHHLVEALQERRANQPPIETAPGEGAYVRVIRYLLQAPMLQLDMEQGAWFVSSLGLRSYFPYFDRDVVELLLRAHPEHLVDGGYHKAPLRRLVAQKLPLLDARARKVGAFRFFNEVIRAQGPARWRDLGGPWRSSASWKITSSGGTTMCCKPGSSSMPRCGSRRGQPRSMDL